MTKNIANLQKKLRWSAYGFFLLYALLLGLLSYWNIMRHDRILWSIWLLQCLPLVVFLPGLLKPYYRSYSWFCFLLLLYFVASVESSFRSTASIPEFLFVSFTASLFIVSMLRSRWLQYSLYQGEEEENSLE